MKDFHIENEKLGSILRTARLDAGFTQKEAADAMQTGIRTIQNWEYGTCTPTLPIVLEYLDNVLKVNSRKYFHLYLDPDYSMYDNISIDELDLRQRLALKCMYSLSHQQAESILNMIDSFEH